MVKIPQISFGKGELSPSLHGRIDAKAYEQGLASAKNCIIHNYGGVSARHGTAFVGPTKHHTYSARLIPFQFKTTDQYMLEFGDLYMRVIRLGGYVLDTATSTISTITQASPAVVTTSAAHGLANGTGIFIAGILGMTELNDNRYVIANVTSTTFELTHHVDGTNIDSVAMTAYISGGIVGSIFELITPYAKEDLEKITYTQSADIITLCHPDYKTRELTRINHDNWTITELRIDTDIVFPITIDITVNTAGVETERYRVTAIDLDTGEESLPGLWSVAAVAITNATQANPVVITATAHTMVTGDEVELFGFVGGMTQLNNNRYFVSNETANTYELTDRDGFTIDGTGFDAYSSGGITNPTFLETQISAVTIDNTITWTTIANTFRYAIYRRKSGVYGLIGESSTLSFDDDNIAPDTSDSHPEFRNPFIDDDEQPGAVGYFEQRRVFGGSLSSPDTNEFSQTANQSNFNKTRPLRQDDAITATLPSLEVNEIRHYIGLNDLLVFTSGSEWIINSGNDSSFGPDTIRQRPQSTWGSSYRKPQLLGTSVLFVSENQTDVRSFGYSFDVDGYTGNNLNVLSRHLTENNQIKDWCSAKTPESRVYMVGANGKSLTLSYDLEQEIVAWTPWDTQGNFESCAALRSGDTCQEDSIYFVVQRTINDKQVRYVELYRQMTTINILDMGTFLDSYLEYEDNVIISNITSANPVVVTTTTAHGLTNGDEIDISDVEWIGVKDDFGGTSQPSQLNGKRFTVANVTEFTLELSSINGTAFTDYFKGGFVRFPTNEVAGLAHLEGETVVCLCDGNVVRDLVVRDSGIVFSRKYSIIHVGLDYIPEIETLNIESPVDNSTVQGEQIKIGSVTIRLFRSRGAWVGPNRDDLQQIKFRTTEDYGIPTQLFSGDHRVIIPAKWDSNGRVFIRQRDPLPLTVLAIIPDIDVGLDV